MLLTWCHSYICFIILSINPITSAQVFYRLISRDDYFEVQDERAPFLNQPFFACASKDDCDELAKKRWDGQFKMVVGKETFGENDVVYKKINPGVAKGTSISKLLHILR